MHVEKKYKNLHTFPSRFAISFHVHIPGEDSDETLMMFPSSRRVRVSLKPVCSVSRAFMLSLFVLLLLFFFFFLVN